MSLNYVLKRKFPPTKFRKQYNNTQCLESRIPGSGLKFYILEFWAEIEILIKNPLPLPKNSPGLYHNNA